MRDQSAARQPTGGPTEPAVAARTKVVSLWHERARRLGLTERVSPDFSALSHRALGELAEQHRALYTHALPVMELLHQQILNTHSMVLLTDQHGLIMHALGDADFLQKAERVALKPGVSWAENSKGTNAIGTALTELRPTLVHGTEHFLAVNRFLTCSCCPIHGPEGELIGALDVSGPQEGYHPHTMGLVRMSTQMIENHLFIDQFERSLRMHFHPRAERVGTLLEGIVAFEPSGRVLAANPNALALLGLDAVTLRQHSLASLFDVDVARLLDRGGVAALQQLHLHCGQVVMARIESSVSTGRRDTPPFAPPRRMTSERHASQARPTLEQLDTGDPAMTAVIGKVRRVCDRAIPILILGETGTGKELLARAIHADSTRAHGPFVAVDCASLPDSLIEAELFGYLDGAFTGARRHGRAGKILLADGGTLFLDEIGDMPLVLQTRLLRVLQERVVLPLGADQERAVDIAVVCATNRDLKDMMRRGTFREDLYYRLNGLTVRLPALRERGDLEALMHGILCEQSHTVPQIAPEVLEALRGYAWPGNLRQLTNVLRTASVLAEDGGMIGLTQLPEDFLEELGTSHESHAERQTLPAQGADLKSLRLSVVAAALQQNAGNVSATARALGVSRNTIYRAIRSSPSV